MYVAGISQMTILAAPYAPIANKSYVSIQFGWFDAIDIYETKFALLLRYKLS